MSQEGGSIISAIPEAPLLGGSQRGARSNHGQDAQVAPDNQSVGNSTIASSIPAAPSLGGAGRHDGAGNQDQGGGQANVPGGVPTQVGGHGNQASTSIQALFSRPVDAPDSDIADSVGVIVRKDQQGDVGSKRYTYTQLDATAALDPPFGVAKHFVSSLDGETEEGNQTQDMWIQDSFAMNLSKVDELNTRLINYDLKRIFLVCVLKAGVNPQSVTHVIDMWGSGTIDMMLAWESIDWVTACYWQYSINKRANDEDRVSNAWTSQLLYNSCTTDLRDQINLKYEHLPATFKGAVTYAWLLFYTLFARSRETVSALKKFLEFFALNGLQKLRGESVVLAKKELVAVCKRLDAARDLPEDTPLDIIKGLQKCSVQPFCNYFAHQLHDATKASLNVTTVGAAQGYVMSEVNEILTEALDLYHSLCTTNQWNIPMGHKLGASLGTTNVTCWNCGGNHTLKDCTEPHDEVQIAKSRKEFFDKRQEQAASDDQLDPAPNTVEPDAPDASEGAGVADSNGALNVTWDDKPSNPPGQVLGAATGATGGEAYGTGVTRQEAQGLFNLARCNAKSDETGTSIEQLAKAMGLNG